MHSISFICHVFHGKALSLHVEDKLLSDHLVMRSYISFIFFKYVILILRKDKYILGRIGLYFCVFGEKLNYFRDLGSKGKYF